MQLFAIPLDPPLNLLGSYHKFLFFILTFTFLDKHLSYIICTPVFVNVQSAPRTSSINNDTIMPLKTDNYAFTLNW